MDFTTTTITVSLSAPTEMLTARDAPRVPVTPASTASGMAPATIPGTSVTSTWSTMVTALTKMAATTTDT